MTFAEPYHFSLLADWMFLVLAEAWHPGIGDPAPIDWVITFGYLATAVLCFVRARTLSGFCMRTSARGHAVRPAQLWYLFSAVTLVLGLNKQLDLQNLLLDFARGAALTEGWYHLRRAFQKVFFGLLAAGTITAGIWLLLRHYVVLRQHRLFVTGLTLVVLYAVLRAADFNHLVPRVSPSIHEHGSLGPLELAGVTLMLCGTIYRSVTEGTRPVDSLSTENGR